MRDHWSIDINIVSLTVIETGIFKEIISHAKETLL